MKRWIAPLALLRTVTPERHGMSVGEARMVLERAIGAHAAIIVTTGEPSPERDYHTVYGRKLKHLLEQLDGLPGWLAVPRWARVALEDQGPATDALVRALRARSEREQWTRNG